VELWVKNIRVAMVIDAKLINLWSLECSYGVTSHTTAVERLTGLLESEDDQVWVFEPAHGVLGWIQLFKAHRVVGLAFTEISGWVVDPRSINKGIGRKLIAWVTQLSKSQNMALRVRCNVKRHGPSPCYAHTGFTLTKIQPMSLVHVV
tara:strand:- start:1238 stop:1681 length:444 start_codon:yes stop_codon:yes gene_type:complete